MKTTRTAAAALLVLAALTGPAWAAEGQDPESGPQGRSDDRGHPVAMETSEQDCWEHNTTRAASWHAIAQRLPAGWEPFFKRTATTGTYAGTLRANVTFVDFTCEDWSIDGLPGRRTTVSWIVAFARATDGSGRTRSWNLEHATDNPLFVERLRKLGVSSRLLTDVTAELTPREDGGFTYRQQFEDRDGVHRYVREGEAPPLGAPRTSTATAWFDGERGPVSITFANTFTGSSNPVTTELTGGGALRDVYQMPDIVKASVPAPSPLQFLRGSWTGTLRLHLAAP